MLAAAEATGFFYVRNHGVAQSLIDLVFDTSRAFFASEVVQKQAVTAFVEQLSTITSDSRHPVLRITGPSELLELVRAKLGVRSIAVELRAAPVAEVSVIADQVFLGTQIKLWAERLKFVVMN